MSGFSRPAREVGARITNSIAQSVANSAAAILTFDTTVRANGVTVGADRITITEPGWYAISGTAEFAANATGYRNVAIEINGTTVIANNATPAITIDQGVTCSTSYYLVATNFVRLRVNQTSSGALNVNASAAYSPVLSVTKLPGAP
jgi:hypothetical protein